MQPVITLNLASTTMIAPLQQHLRHHTVLWALPCLFGLFHLLTMPQVVTCLSSVPTTTTNSPVFTPLTPSFELDTVKSFAESTFPHSPDTLIERTKELFSPEIGLGLKDGGACLADDFEFTAAVVGPLDKESFITALSGFRLEDSFAIQQNAFGFTVSPIQTNRVFFFTYNVAQMTNTFLGVTPEQMDGKLLVLPPQCVHVDFDEDLKVKEFGFYTVDRQYGNTGGLGGAFGFFYGVGRPLPFREAQPFKRSFRFRILNAIGRLGSALSKKKKEVKNADKC